MSKGKKKNRKRVRKLMKTVTRRIEECSNEVCGASDFIKTTCKVFEVIAKSVKRGLKELKENQ